MHSRYIKKMSDQTGKSYRELESMWKIAASTFDRLRMMDPSKYANLSSKKGTIGEEIKKIFEKSILGISKNVSPDKTEPKEEITKDEKELSEKIQEEIPKEEPEETISDEEVVDKELNEEKEENIEEEEFNIEEPQENVDNSNEENNQDSEKEGKEGKEGKEKSEDIPELKENIFSENR